MEAKVDIRKLQLLNERIAQTIEALNQVRLSVHSAQVAPYGQAQGFGSNVQSFGAPSFGAPSLFGTQGQQPMLSHSPYAPSNMSPWQNQVSPWEIERQRLQGQQGQQGSGVGAVSPLSQIPFGVSGLQHAPYGQASVNPFAQGQNAMGIGSIAGQTETEQRYLEMLSSDPSRLAQTFPYAFAGGRQGI